MIQTLLDTPIGKLGLCADGDALVRIGFVPMAQVPLGECAVLSSAAEQLTAYFAGELRVFDLPLAPTGTDFQRRVWDALCTVPYGTTATYADIAKKIGSPKAMRAVGQANNLNPLPIVIPCHRVIGADGSLVGYAGGLETKKTLLRLEGIRV